MDELSLGICILPNVWAPLSPRRPGQSQEAEWEGRCPPNGRAGGGLLAPGCAACALPLLCLHILYANSSGESTSTDPCVCQGSCGVWSSQSPADEPPQGSSPLPAAGLSQALTTSPAKPAPSPGPLCRTLLLGATWSRSRGRRPGPRTQTRACSLVSRGNLRLSQILSTTSSQPERDRCFLCFYYKHIILIGKTLNTSFTVIKSKH